MLIDRRRLTSSIAVLLACVTAAGCGGSDESAASEAPDRTPTATAARQQIERFTTEFDAEQAQRIFGDNEEGIDPAVFVGEWALTLNETLGILEVLAPDGGGPIMEIAERDGDRLELTEQMCPKGFAVRVERSAEAIAFRRLDGRCTETIALLVEQPWQAVPAGE